MKHTLLLIFVLSTAILFSFKSNSYKKDSTLQQKFQLLEQEFSINQYRPSSISQAERFYRIKVFENNYNHIQNHNSKLGKSYQLGINQFLAITKQQFQLQYLSEYKPHQNYIQTETQQIQNLIVDWVYNKAVTSVKNQGKCNANYAFAVVGAMEGVSAIFGNKLQQYSAQQIVDCSDSYGNSKCDGGDLLYVYFYLNVFNNVLQSDYPWTGQDGNCLAKQPNKRLKTFGNIGSCNEMENHLRKSPISVVVDGQNMQFYKSGIFNNCETNLSLPLLLVGLTDSYYNLKNSWGQTWGQNGFIRISRGNTCGVCQLGYYPVPK